MSGLITCGQCGSPFTGGGGPKGAPGDRDRFRFYRCSGTVKRKPVCGPPTCHLSKRHIEPKVIDAVAAVVSSPIVADMIWRRWHNGLRRGGGAGRRPAPRRPARAAGLRRGAPQVGENLVDHSGLGNEGDDAHLVSAPGTLERVDLKDPAQQLRPAAAGFRERGRHG